MNFVTFQFILFLFISLLVFVFLKNTNRKYFILLCSYFFYGTWSIPLIGVILFSTSVDYYLGKKIYLTSSKTLKKLFLTCSILINCSLLVYFKYTNFLLSTFNFLELWWGYSSAGFHSINIILPLGISFYTFEAISYIVDIYRGEKPASSWLNYNFYIMYFPHLISGPIVRYKELYKQYEGSINLPNTLVLKEGMQLILYGFIFKLIIADNVASISDPLFEQYQAINHLESWLAAISFTLQIYFDFLGYTHIARGVSLLFNIRLPLNFNHPYNSRNISEFWQRWHITLSSWIRDYLYIPLGGSRGTLVQTLYHLMLTMFIAGLWHGSSWNYALWGMYHGFLLGLYHLFRASNRIKTFLLSENKVLTLFSTALTFSLVVVGWIIFRSSSLEQAYTVLFKMFDFAGFAHEIVHNDKGSLYSDSLILLVTLLILCFIGPLIKQLEHSLLSGIQQFWIKKILYSFSLFTLLIFMFSPTKPFIYFVF